MSSWFCRGKASLGFLFLSLACLRAPGRGYLAIRSSGRGRERNQEPWINHSLGKSVQNPTAGVNGELLWGELGQQPVGQNLPFSSSPKGQQPQARLGNDASLRGQALGLEAPLEMAETKKSD